MAEGPSAESKLNIATYFIMSSPTGELNDVVKDVTKLVQDPATLTDDALTNIIKAYNHEQMAFAPHPKGDGSHAMVSEFGLTADGKYFNPQVSQNLSYDHKAQKFSGATDGKSTASPALDKYRAATQAALDKYLEGSYKAGKVCGVVYAGEGSKLTICISAKNVHLGNFWTGGWRSCYGIDVKVGSANLTGTIKVNVHYFEDGNVQLHANVNQAAKVNVTAKEDETGTAIAGAIAKIENDFHSHLEEMYVKMHTTTFKQMRRFYSLQREPMRWSVAAHAMANEVAANKQQA